MSRPVLVVEDDEDIRESLALLLRSIGFEVETASNGRTALEVLRRIETPCLILLDLSMPVMNGEEFRAHQLRDPVLSQVPAILISADIELRKKALALKIPAAIQKPVEMHELLSAINRLRHRGNAGQRTVE